MEVILLERIEKLGQMGDIVKVKPGFARNYLLPQNKALRSNKENLAAFEAQKIQLEAANLKRRQEAEQVAEKMAGLNLVIVRQAAETGQLYGSVTGRDVRDAVREAGFNIERRQVVLDQPLKEIGVYKIRIILHPDSYCIDRLIIGEPVSASAFLIDLILMVSWYCIMDLSKGNRSTIQHLLCHVLRYRCIFGDGFHNHFIDFP